MNEFLQALETGWGLEVVLWSQSWRTPLLFDAAFALSLTGEVMGFVSTHWGRGIIWGARRRDARPTG